MFTLCLLRKVIHREMDPSKLTRGREGRAALVAPPHRTIASKSRRRSSTFTLWPTLALTLNWTLTFHQVDAAVDERFSSLKLGMPYMSSRRRDGRARRP